MRNTPQTIERIEQKSLRYPKTYSFKRHFGKLIDAFELNEEEIWRLSALPLNRYDTQMAVTPAEFVKLLNAIYAQLNQKDAIFDFLDESIECENNSVVLSFRSGVTLDEAMARLRVIKPLESPVMIEEVDRGEFVTFVFHSIDEHVAIPLIFQALQAYWLRNLILYYTDVSSVEASAESFVFEIPDGLTLEEVDKKRLTPSIFYGKSVGLRLPKHALDLPIKSALEPSIVAPTASKESDLEARVKFALRGILASGRSTLSDVAARLNTSSRTLQRKLQKEGLLFSDILLQTRLEMADELLQNPDITVKEIAFLLDYSEPSALYRAYRNSRGYSLQLGKRDMLLSRKNKGDE